MNEKVIRAVFDEHTITVYQAFNSNIALSALKFQTFVPPFKKERMTWIKPSFFWMMYRSGWASKENQEHILSIKMKREGFEWALANSSLSNFDNSSFPSHESWKFHSSKMPVRIQWDPERDLQLQRLPYRAIQIGLSGIAIELYLENWISEIKDITILCKEINRLISDGKINQAKDLLPSENIYPLPEVIAKKIT